MADPTSPTVDSTTTPGAPEQGAPVSPLTRRVFLERVAVLGGATALMETLVAMGMAGRPGTAWAGPPKFAPDHGGGRSVLVLGAGIGGLTTAYVLNRAGYRVRILEASGRAGGRNHTARRGATVIENHPTEGRIVQECTFDSGLYVNLGPGRLPYHHRRVLGYCQELGVKLEPYIMNTTGNLFQSTEGFDGERVRYRDIQADTRGHIASLLAQVVTAGDSQVIKDQGLSKEQTEELLALLQVFGDLSATPAEAKAEAEAKAAAEARGDNPDCVQLPNTAYVGSTRAGCKEPTPDVDEDCTVEGMLPLKALLDAKFWQQGFYSPDDFLWQPTLFQPVGGMDMIVEGFLRQVGHLIEYNAPITAIEATTEGVTVTWLRGKEEVYESADYCVSNIPCPILDRLDTNFAKEKRKKKREEEGLSSFAAAIKACTFDASCKVGWQANERFWENDDNEIYGGISWTNDIIEQIWYPSYDYFSQKGTLTGAYVHDHGGPCGDGDNATVFGKLSLKQRIATAKEGGARLHEEIANDDIVPPDQAVSIAWQYVEHQEGAWPGWSETDGDKDEHYRRLLLPFRKRFFIVGDQASTLPGWQEGAMMSAEWVCGLIAGTNSPKDLLEDAQAPNSRFITRGAR